MAPANKKSDDLRESAERMRRDGKSLAEISAALGVSVSAICKWAKAGKWPDPRKSQQQVKQAVRQIVTQALDPSAPIDLDLFDAEKLEKVAENVILYALKALCACPTGANIKAALDASVRIYLAKEEVKQIRQFSVMLPPVAEVYGDQTPSPPHNSQDKDK